MPPDLNPSRNHTGYIAQAPDRRTRRRRLRLSQGRGARLDTRAGRGHATTQMR